MACCVNTLKRAGLFFVFSLVFLCSVQTTFASNNNEIPVGYDPMMDDPEERLSVEERVKRQITEFLFSIKDIIPQDEAHKEFYQRVALFIPRFEAYLTKYYKAVDIMEPMVFETDNLGRQNEILKEQLGYDARDLAKELEILTRIINYDIAQDIDLYYKQMALEELKSGPKEREAKYESKPLSEVIKEAKAELADYRKAWKEYAEKAAETKNRLSGKARKFVNLAATDAEIGLEFKGVKGIAQMILFEEILSYTLQDKEEKFGRVREKGIKGTELFVDAMSKIDTDPNLNEKDRARRTKAAKSYIAYVVDKEGRDSKQITKMMSKGYMVKAHAGSAVNMYFAIIAKDLFNVATSGRFLTEEQRAIYVEKKGDKVVFKYTFRDFWYETFNRYLNPTEKEFYQTHIPFASFVIGAEIVRSIPTPKLVNNLYNFCNKGMFGYGGKMLRGMVGYTLSMGIGAKLSEVVGSTMIFWKELNSEDPTVRAIAGELVGKTVYDPKAWAGTAKFVVAFGITDLALQAFIIKPIKYTGMYLKMNKLNKGRCKWLLEDIRNFGRKQPLVKPWYETGVPKFTISLLRNSTVFIGSQFVENYLLNGWFLQGAIDSYNKEVNELYEQLFDAELELLTQSLLDAEVYDRQLGPNAEDNFELVLDKLQGYMILEKLVGGIRSEYRPEAKKCLDLIGVAPFDLGEPVKPSEEYDDQLRLGMNDNIKPVRNPEISMPNYMVTDKEARACLEALYIKIMAPETYEVYKYTDPLKYNELKIKDNNMEHKESVKDYLRDEAMGMLTTPGAQDSLTTMIAIKTIMDPLFQDQQADAIVKQEKFAALEDIKNLAGEQFRVGNMEEGKKILGLYFTNLPLVIEEGGPYINDEFAYISKVIDGKITEIISSSCEGNDEGYCWAYKQARLFKEVYPDFIVSPQGGGLDSNIKTPTPRFIEVRIKVLNDVTYYMLSKITGIYGDALFYSREAKGFKFKSGQNPVEYLYQTKNFIIIDPSYPAVVRNAVYDSFTNAGWPIELPY